MFQFLIRTSIIVLCLTNLGNVLADTVSKHLALRSTQGHTGQVEQYVIASGNDLPNIVADTRFIVVQENFVLNSQLLQNINTAFATRPDLTLIVEFSSNIPDNWAYDEHAKLSLIPQNVKHITLIGDQVAKVGKAFLKGGKNLKTVDLSGLKGITEVGEDFMVGCGRLLNLDLAALKDTIKIGKYFLQTCIDLQHVDLSALTKVQEVGTGILSGCYGLLTLKVGDNPVIKSSISSDPKLSIISDPSKNESFMTTPPPLPAKITPSQDAAGSSSSSFSTAISPTAKGPALVITDEERRALAETSPPSIPVGAG